MSDLVIGAQRHAPIRENQSVFKILFLTLTCVFATFAVLTITCAMYLGVRAKHLRKSNMKRILLNLQEMTSTHLLPAAVDAADYQSVATDQDGPEMQDGVVSRAEGRRAAQ